MGTLTWGCPARRTLRRTWRSIIRIDGGRLLLFDFCDVRAVEFWVDSYEILIVGNVVDDSKEGGGEDEI